MMDKSQCDAFVFFGASGDLAYKQIFPSLQGLVRDEGFDAPIIGVAKSGWTVKQLKDRAKDSLEHNGGVDKAAFQKLAELLHYVDGDYNDPATFAQLRTELGDAQRPLHYLAIPPSMFAVVVKGLADARATANAHVVVEKPFGRDLASARELNQILRRYFPEEAIFRIDHYLGKEPVQNILYTRFANPMFEPIWNRDYVDSIQLTMSEDYGVGDRGRFFEETGTIRDVIQNHMLQVLTNLVMDPPTSNDREALRDEKARLLKAIRPLSPAHVVRGQYLGYRDEKDISPTSKVETYAAIKLCVDTWRWSGVPIYIRAGKKLAVSATEVMVEFKRPPRETFGEIVPALSSHMRMRISPDICIALGVRVKLPGDRMVGDDVEMMLTRHDLEDMPPYQRLLGDAMRGSNELFARQDAVEAQWAVVEPVLNNVTPLYLYQPGSWGPEEANQLIGADGPWMNPSASSSGEPMPGSRVD
jgi:glucose-6-phosphate 1-dehydrogenase